MRIQFLFLALVIASCFAGVHAQALKFRKDGTFRIVQFTDIHYDASSPTSRPSLKVMEETLDAEKPDLVVFTGDVVTRSPNKKGWDDVLQVAISRRIPYVVTFGNHDDEGDLKREALAEYVVSKPYLVNKVARIPGVSGYLNAAITIEGTNGKPGAIIYAMDSHAYTAHPRVKGYGWFMHDQVSWFRNTSASFVEAHKDTLPALAFFHIPLPEYKLAFDDLGNRRIGVRYEKECPPDINTGMFTAMLEAGDVMGMFVGHDHTNDYLVDYYDIALAYGACTRGGESYKRSKSGARIIELTQGKRQFHTYIRELDGQKIYPVDFPFPKPKK